jgi:hypothetical protein
MDRLKLTVGAVVLGLIVLGAIFWSNIVTLAFGSVEDKFVESVVERGKGGGYSAVFGGSDAKKWYIATGHRLERLSLGGDAVVARLTSTTPLDRSTFEWPTQGLSIQLPVEFAERSNGKPIEIGIVARVSHGRVTAPLTVVYATRQGGNSGWQQLEVGGEFEIKTLSYAVPVREGGYTNPPVLVINSDPSGAGGAIELIGVYIKIVGGK